MTDLLLLGDVHLEQELRARATGVAPDGELELAEEERVLRPGGIARAAIRAKQLGVQVTLLSALADDDAGGALRHLLEGAGISVHAVRAPQVTAHVTDLLVDGGRRARLMSGETGPSRELPLRPLARSALDAADVVLVRCHEGGPADHPEVRDLLRALAAAVPVVWDDRTVGRRPTPVAGCHLVVHGPDRFPDGAVTGEQLERLRVEERAAAAVVTVPEGVLLAREGAGPELLPGALGADEPSPSDGDHVLSAALHLAAGVDLRDAVARATAGGTP